MFVRIDKDLAVNINNIFSYKLFEDGDSYKLQVWGVNGTPIHTVIYLKDRPDQMQLLIDFNNTLRDLTVNNEVIRNVQLPIEQLETEEDEQLNKAIEERQEIDAQIEAEKEKLIDAKIELAMLKDKAKDIMTKFTDDITSLQ